MKRVIMLMAAMLVLAGCNTVAGVGKDVEKAGEAIQRSTK
jgi:predicted small secreted protein